MQVYASSCLLKLYYSRQMHVHSSIITKCPVLINRGGNLDRGNPYRFLRFERAYGRTMQSLWIFILFADSHLQSFHSLYSNCCQFAVTPSMLHEVKHATAAYNREHENKLSVSQQVVFCLLLCMGVLQWDPMPKLCFVMVLTSCKDFFADCKDFLSWSYR